MLWKAKQVLNRVILNEMNEIKTAWERYIAELPPDQNALNRAAFHLLRQGQAPSVSQLAEILDLPEAQCRSLIKVMLAIGSVTIDDDRITGAGGLSIVPTFHQITLADIQLYCWCALDTLGIPAALAEDADITSEDGQSGNKLRLRFEAGRLVDFPNPLRLQLAPPDQTRLLCGGT
ncbi:MAG: hypothetical protein EPN30_07460 [Actinomycetota bacterium]|nr:MAG: hypothetical protein EPN30_07460 [Actinomycetota bacterium]